MSPRLWGEWLQDILDAITEIQAFVVGMDYESFKNDAKTVRAVELDFIVIGEAANQLPSEIVDNYPEIPLVSHASDAQPSGTRLLRCGSKIVMGYDSE